MGKTMYTSVSYQSKVRFSQEWLGQVLRSEQGEESIVAKHYAQMDSPFDSHALAHTHLQQTIIQTTSQTIL
jgi:hypothetical protein